jgi:hypothetical protein
LGALVAPDRPLVALGQNHHQVHVAVIGRRAPSVRTEQINFLRLKLGFQPLDYIFQKAGLDCFHGVKTSIMVADLKARVCGRRDVRATFSNFRCGATIWFSPLMASSTASGLARPISRLNRSTDSVGIRLIFNQDFFGRFAASSSSVR